MRRKREPKSRDPFDRSHEDDLDLATAPDSDLSDFGDTATRGFSDAWDDADDVDGDASSAAAEFGSDPDDSSGRDLDARSKRGVLLLFLIVLVGGGLGVAAQQGVFESDESAPGQEVAGEGPLLAPEDARSYDAEPTSIQLAASATSADGFRTIEGQTPVPEELIPGLPASVGAGPVLWAGRLHIAMFADGIGSTEDVCAVATLVTSQLAAIDIAGFGNCDPALDGTGDRLACQGNDLILLEVWPDDPSSPVEPPPVAAIRYRLERPVGVTDGADLVSLRGSLTVPAGPTPLLSAASELGGAPGDEVTVATADGQLAETCTLVDRSDVPVKLLPS